MSHLQHINAYKVNLIAKDITSPEEQIALVRNAYICSFVKMFTLENINQSDRENVMQYVLAYWNETFPVNGPYVISAVKGFYERLYSSLTHVCCDFTVAVHTDETSKKYPDYAQVDGFKSLVDTLTKEAIHKYREIKG